MNIITAIEHKIDFYKQCISSTKTAIHGMEVQTSLYAAIVEDLEKILDEEKMNEKAE